MPLSGRLFFMLPQHAGSGEAPAETSPLSRRNINLLSTETISDFILSLQLPPSRAAFISDSAAVGKEASLKSSSPAK